MTMQNGFTKSETNYHTLANPYYLDYQPLSFQCSGDFVQNTKMEELY